MCVCVERKEEKEGDRVTCSPNHTQRQPEKKKNSKFKKDTVGKEETQNNVIINTSSDLFSPAFEALEQRKTDRKQLLDSSQKL